MDSSSHRVRTFLETVGFYIGRWYRRQLFRRYVVTAVSTRSLEAELVEDLETRAQLVDLGITNLGWTSRSAYRRAVENYIQLDRATPEAKANLNRVRMYFEIPTHRIENADVRFHHAYSLNEIKAGRLPVLSDSSFSLKKDERAHWSEPAELMEIKVIGRRYVGGSSGVSFRVARGVSYRVGRSRGYSVSEKGVVTVARGQLVITSARLVYQGDAKAFELKLDQVLNYTMADDGIVITSGKREKPYVLKFVSSRYSSHVHELLKQCLKSRAA